MRPRAGSTLMDNAPGANRKYRSGKVVPIGQKGGGGAPRRRKRSRDDGKTGTGLKSVEELLNEDGFGVTGGKNSCSGRVLYHVERIKNGMYGLLYLVSKDAQSTRFIVVSTVAVNVLQLLRLSFSTEGRFLWNSDLKNTLSPFLDVFAFAFANKLDGSVALVIFAILFFLLVLCCGLSMTVQREFANGGVKNLHILPTLRFLLRILTTVFYVPMISMLLFSLECNNVFSQFAACGTVPRTAFSVVVVLLLIWFIVFAGLVVLVFGQRDPASMDPEAGPHKRIEFVNSLVRAVLEFCFSVFSSGAVSDSNPNRRLLIGLVNLSGCWLTISYVYYLPYYSMFTNRIMACGYALFWWSGICLVFTEVVQDVTDYSSVFLFFLGSPLFMYSTSVFVDWRASWLEAMEMQLSPYLEEVRLRLKYPFVEGRGDFTHYMQRRSKMKGNQKATKEEDRIQVQDVVHNGLDEEKVKIIRDPETRIRYKEATEKWRWSGFLHLHTSLIEEKIYGNRVFADMYSKKAKNMNLAFDQQFIIYQKALQEKERETGAVGAISYLVFDHHVKQAQISIAECVQLLAKFWAALYTGEVSVNMFHDLSVLVHNATGKCRHHLRALRSVNASSRTVLGLHAVYNEFVLNEEGATQKMASCIGVTQDGIVDCLASTSFGEAEILERKFSISMEPRMVGKIVQSTPDMNKALGFDDKPLVGENLFQLVPENMKAILKDGYASFCAYASDFKPVNTEILLRHKQGFFVLANLSATPFINDSGEYELAIEYQDLLPQEKSFFLLDEKGHVTGVSKKGGELIAAHRRHFTDQNYKTLLPWLPDDILQQASQVREFLIDIPNPKSPVVLESHLVSTKCLSCQFEKSDNGALLVLVETQDEVQAREEEEAALLKSVTEGSKEGGGPAAGVGETPEAQTSAKHQALFNKVRQASSSLAGFASKFKRANSVDEELSDNAMTQSFQHPGSLNMERRASAGDAPVSITAAIAAVQNEGSVNSPPTAENDNQVHVDDENIEPRTANSTKSRSSNVGEEGDAHADKGGDDDDENGISKTTSSFSTRRASDQEATTPRGESGQTNNGNASEPSQIVSVSSRRDSIPEDRRGSSFAYDSMKAVSFSKRKMQAEIRAMLDRTDSGIETIVSARSKAPTERSDTFRGSLRVLPGMGDVENKGTMKNINTMMDNAEKTLVDDTAANGLQSFHNTILRAIAEETPEVKTFTRWSRIFTLFVLVAFSLSQVMVHQIRDGYLLSAEKTHSSHVRSAGIIEVTSLMFNLRNMTLSGRDFFGIPENVDLDALIETNMLDLRAQAKQIKLLHREIVNDDARISSNTEMFRLSTGEESTFWVGTLWFCNHADAYTQNEFPHVCGDSCEFILDNGIETILNVSLSESEEQFKAQTAWFGLFEYFAMICMILAFIFVAFFWFQMHFPFLVYAKHRRTHVASMFRMIPPDTITYMYWLYRGRINQLQSLRSNSESGSPDNPLDVVLEEDSQGPEQRRSSVLVSRISSVFHRTDGHHRKRKLHIPKIVKSAMVILLPTVVFIAYYVGALLTTSLMSELAEEQASSFATGERFVRSMELLFLLRRSTPNDMATLDSLVSELSTLNEHLAFGDPDTLVRPIHIGDPAQNKLLYEEACSTLVFPKNISCVVQDESNPIDQITDMQTGLNRVILGIMDFAKGYVSGDEVERQELWKQIVYPFYPITRFKVVMGHSLDLAYNQLYDGAKAIVTDRAIRALIHFLVIWVLHFLVLRKVFQIDLEVKQTLNLLLLVPENSLSNTMLDELELQES